jgi:hypothetical protein
VRRIEIAKSEILAAPTIESDETPIIRKAEPADDEPTAESTDAPAAETAPEAAEDAESEDESDEQ